MDGVINVDKPSGPTSHDVVDRIRQLIGQKRVGHAGTLDPLASGVLLICIGRATRIVEYLMSAWKEYRVRMILGVETDTGDAVGQVTAEHDASGITRAAFEEVVSSFVGEIEQVPPLYSAVKHDGKRLYELAREGKIVQPSARKVTIYSIEVVSFDGDRQAQRKPQTREAELVVRCSSGTYIRSLCTDIGSRLGCGAHVSALRRTCVGKFRAEDAATLDELESAASEGRLKDYVMSLDRALELAEMPSVQVDQECVAAALNGRRIRCDFRGQDGTAVRILAPDGTLLAVGKTFRYNGKTGVHPQKVFIPENRGQ
ncbi:MAG: tRNA pseudouridine(55) synthase TruB [Armatimonadota bacterium]|nr:tRNA pseudouridine(55) synthase TruB [Armatimonadota bacterium]